DRPGRYFETKVINQQAVAKSFAYVFKLNHFVTQALGHRDKDLLCLVTLLVLVRSQLFKAAKTRFGLRLTALRILPHPFQLFLNGALACRLGRLFLFQTVFFLLQPRTVVTTPWNTVATVKLKNPLGDVIQEITVVGNRHDGARKLT